MAPESQTQPKPEPTKEEALASAEKALEESQDPFDALFEEWEEEEKVAEEERRKKLIAEGKDPDDVADQQAEDVEEMVDDSDLVTDVEYAFAEKEYEWEIPTGRYNDKGRPVSVLVKVRDPGDGDLPMKFIFALQKDPVRAEEALWRACVISPKALTQKGAVAKTTSVFRSTLTNRLRLLIGINRDFLESLAEMMGAGQTGRRGARKPSAKSEQPSESPPGKSSDSSTEGGSTTPTDGPTSGGSKNAQGSSPTSPTSSPRPLPTSPAKSSTPTSVDLGSDLTHSN